MKEVSVDKGRFSRFFQELRCTCNPATLETKFRNGVGSIPVGGNSPSIGGWVV